MKKLTIRAYIYRVLKYDERGEIGQADEYTVNGVKYVVESVFLEKTEKNASLKNRIAKILENEDSYLTTTANDVKMAENYMYSAADKEDKNAVEKE